MWDAVIIGAGLSGLVACREVGKRPGGERVLVLEARGRIGGRVDTRHGADFGAAWLWPLQNRRLTALAREMGVVLVDDADVVRSTSDTGANSTDDVCFWDLYEYSMQDVRRVKSEHRRSGEQMRFAAGTGALVEALERECFRPQRRGAVKLRLGARVTQISLEEQKSSTQRNNVVRVEYETSDGDALRACNERARVVICAAPVRLLANHVQFSPELPELQMRAMRKTRTWMAQQTKVVAWFTSRFWQQRCTKFSCRMTGTVFSNVGPLASIFDVSVPPRVFALAGFTAASRQRRACTEAGTDLCEAVTMQLERLFGAAARSECVRIEFHDWSEDKYTCDAEDRAVADPWEHPQYTYRFAPLWNSALVFAGSETCADGSGAGGFLEGAVRAGERAATEASNILEHFGQHIFSTE